MSTIVSFVSM